LKEKQKLRTIRGVTQNPKPVSTENAILGSKFRINFSLKNYKIEILPPKKLTVRGRKSNLSNVNQES
jgi:hypothetical protein